MKWRGRDLGRTNKWLSRVPTARQSTQYMLLKKKSSKKIRSDVLDACPCLHFLKRSYNENPIFTGKQNCLHHWKLPPSTINFISPVFELFIKPPRPQPPRTAQTTIFHFMSLGVLVDLHLYCFLVHSYRDFEIQVRVILFYSLKMTFLKRSWKFWNSCSIMQDHTVSEK